MGLITDFYVAPRALAAGALDGSKLKGLPVAQLKGLDPVKLESLERILATSLKSKGKPGDTAMLTDETAEQWVLLVSPTLVALLARAQDVVSAVAATWAKTPELKAERWTAAAVKTALTQLVALAAQAAAKKTDLLLKMSM